MDSFGFPVGGRLATLRAVFWPLGRILAILGQSPKAIISTLNFGPSLWKVGGIVQATKKMTHIDLVPAGITEKWPDLRFAEKQKTGRKSVL